MLLSRIKPAVQTVDAYDCRNLDEDTVYVRARKSNFTKLIFLQKMHKDKYS